MALGFFEIMAECAVALAGFGAVHAMLKGSEGPRGMARAWCVVAYAGSVAFLAFLPLVLEYSNLEPVIIWRVASALGVLGGVFVVVSLHLIDRSLSKIEIHAQIQLGKNSVLAAGYLAMLVMGSSLAGWPLKPGAFIYGVGLMILFAAAFLPLFFSFLLPLIEAMQDDKSSPEADG